MQPPRKPVVASVGTVLAVVLAACSTTSASTGTTRPSVPTTTAPGTQSARVACASVTPAQVRATTGTTVGAPTVAVHGSVATCTYTPSGAGQPLVIQYASGADTVLFATDQTRVSSTHGPTTPVTGLGDHAYYFTTPAGSQTATTLVVLTGSLQFIVTSTSSITQVEGLAQLVLYAVGVARSSATTQPTTASTPTTAVPA